MGRSCRACWMQMGTCPCWKNPLCGRSAWRTSSMSCAQLEKARSAGIRVTHLDSHMGTLFRTKELLEIYTRLGGSYQLPVLLPREAFHSAPTIPFPNKSFFMNAVLQLHPAWPIER